MNGASKLAILSCLLLFGVFSAAMLSLPAFGSPLMAAANVILSRNVADTSAANVVCSVTLDYRGYDTLGEAMLLSAAVGGVVIVLKPRKKDERKLIPRVTEFVVRK